MERRRQHKEYKRGQSYYSDVTPGVTSGTEGLGGGASSTRQSSIVLNGSTSESVYGKRGPVPSAPAKRGEGSKSSTAERAVLSDSRGRFIMKL